MFDAVVAERIFQSGMLDVVRRSLFTATRAGRETQAFELDAFFQHGTGIVLLSKGTVYALTPSHVVRNATRNQYTNDSPVWFGTGHKQPEDLMDFLMPMRVFDMSPGGDTSVDAALIEMNPMIFRLTDWLDWDRKDLFCDADDQLQWATAVVCGYPEQVNPYTFYDKPDGSVQQVANIKRTYFTGLISTTEDKTWFTNLDHRDGYEYPGLSGSVVVCSVNGTLKYLGVVISIGDKGRRFKILRFSEIRAAVGDLRDLEWEVLDEAYFMRHPTHTVMNYDDFRKSMKGEVDFEQQRENGFLEQLLRTMKQGSRPHWVLDVLAAHDEMHVRLRGELIHALQLVKKQKYSDPVLKSHAAGADSN